MDSPRHHSEKALKNALLDTIEQVTHVAQNVQTRLNWTQCHSSSLDDVLQTLLDLEHKSLNDENDSDRLGDGSQNCDGPVDGMSKASTRDRDALVDSLDLVLQKAQKIRLDGGDRASGEDSAKTEDTESDSRRLSSSTSLSTTQSVAPDSDVLRAEKKSRDSTPKLSLELRRKLPREISKLRKHLRKFEDMVHDGTGEAAEMQPKASFMKTLHSYAAQSTLASLKQNGTSSSWKDGKLPGIDSIVLAEYGKLALDSFFAWESHYVKENRLRHSKADAKLHAWYRIKQVKKMQEELEAALSAYNPNVPFISEVSADKYIEALSDACKLVHSEHTQVLCSSDPNPERLAGIISSATLLQRTLPEVARPILCCETTTAIEDDVLLSVLDQKLVPTLYGRQAVASAGRDQASLVVAQAMSTMLDRTRQRSFIDVPTSRDAQPVARGVT